MVRFLKNPNIFLGRHLLVEIFGKNQFIPNDYFCYNYIDDFDNNFTSPIDCLINKSYSNKCSILTGANYSGKSIFLKSIGIIVFLAQIGSFVPASGCKLGLFDKILTSIQHFDSIAGERIEGIAAKELSNMARVLRIATNRSLILIDEFPKRWHCNIWEFNIVFKIGFVFIEQSFRKIKFRGP